MRVMLLREPFRSSDTVEYRRIANRAYDDSATAFPRRTRLTKLDEGYQSAASEMSRRVERCSRGVVSAAVCVLRRN